MYLYFRQSSGLLLSVFPAPRITVRIFWWRSSSLVSSYYPSLCWPPLHGFELNQILFYIKIVSNISVRYDKLWSSSLHSPHYSHRYGISILWNCINIPDRGPTSLFISGNNRGFSLLSGNYESIKTKL